MPWQVKHLDENQKALVAGLTHPSQLDVKDFGFGLELLSQIRRLPHTRFLTHDRSAGCSTLQWTEGSANQVVALIEKHQKP